jgi:PTH1 family peptidyl-tRNA hydrolase
MYYLVGLGNSGLDYELTRHNVGWIVLDALCVRHQIPTAVMQNSLSGRVSTGNINGIDVNVLYPETMMNNSGAAVSKFVSANNLQRLVVLYDDIDLPLGEVRVSFGRGDGGHNGIKSIIEKVGSRDFVRVRIGIGKVGFWPWEKGVLKRPQGDKLPRYVLGKFSKHEREVVEKVVSRVDEVVRVIVVSGYTTAMNRFN